MAAPLDHHWSMQTRPVVSLIAPSAAYRIDDWMGAARRLGVGVAVVTEAHHGLAEDMGAELIPIDFDDPADAAVRIAASPLPIEAIIPVDDRGVEIAARAAALRGLVHNPVGTAAATRDKAQLRRRLQGIVPQPRFMALEAGRPGREARAVGVPAVVKPVGLSGSTGVIRVDDPRRLDAVIERVRSIATAHGRPPDSPVLVEQYVPGEEVAVEGMVTGGRWDTLAVFDKPDPLEGPYFTETHYTTPSRHPPEVVTEIEAVSSRAARALGIVRGSVHAELRIGRQVVLLEVASRAIGGLCGRSLLFGLSETPLEELLIRNALGIRVRGVRRTPGASGVSMIPVPSRGVFTGIDGVEEALQIEHVVDIEVSRLVGREVAPLPDESTYLGFVFARAPTPEQVETALRQASDILQVRIEPATDTR